jgi:signal transduction histidine kinase/CheY-like chemotaxis protein
MKKRWGSINWVAVSGALWGVAAASLACGVSPTVVAYGLTGVTGIAWGGVAYTLRTRPLRGCASKQVLEHSEVVEKQTSRFERSSFLATVCHEIRTPLHNIMGLVNIVARHNKDKTQTHYLKLIHEASQHLLNTINGVLDFSKADTGMLSVLKKEARVDEIVRQALRTVAPQAYQKSGLELLCEFDQQVPLNVQTDATRVGQILINLLGNAIKFTTSGYVKLRVSLDATAAQHSPKLLFEVSDTGAGIPEHDLGTIFEPFSQVDMTIVRKASGTGLGLTIVKQLVALLGGDVGVSSELKKGSTFWFTLPASPEALASATTLHPEFQGRRVCVVSAGRHFAQLASAVLRNRGATVTVFDSLDLTRIEPENGDFYLITEDVMQASEAAAFLSQLTQRGMINSVALFLSPAAVEIRKRCDEFNFSQVVSLPMISTDIIDVVSGNVTQNSDDSFAAGLARSERSLHVLIADDLPTNQIILRTLLEEAGHKVTSVSDGDELVALVSQRSQTKEFDLVLTDVQMPRLDGVSAIRQIRALESERRAAPLPLVAITAHALEDERQRIITAGADDILSKPFRPQELQRILELVSPTRVDNSTIVAVSLPVAPDPVHAFVQDIKGAMRKRLGTDDGELLDVHDLFERSGDSPRRTLLILKSFIECYRPVLDELHEAEQGARTDDLGRVAHKLRGLFAEVGAKGVSAKAAHLEELSRDAEGHTHAPEQMVSLVPSLLDEAERVAEAVESVLQECS